MTEKQRLLIVGGVAGGASCAARARRLSEDAEIIVFERGPYVSFANCGLPYHVGNVIPRERSLFLASPESFKMRFNIDVRTNSNVRSVDRETKTIEVENLNTGEVYRERYVHLVLSPGAAPLRPNLDGIDLPGIFTLRTIPDMREIKDWMKNRIMPVMDAELAAFIHDHLKSKDISLCLGSPVTGFEENNDGTINVMVASGTSISADMVILAIGVRPEVELAKAAGLTIGDRGGILVDEQLRTSDESILAVGDAIEVEDFVTGAKSLVPLAGPANRQG
ncbi:MAG: FAD-dependent oxidoreductase, partial [Deltaproteobacteria bacterium]|nr:FAD-dependent oxidoreductase [Deltaproteobacteria bacterium]